MCKLHIVYRYIVYNEKTFTHILHKEKSYIKSFCYNIVETHSWVFIQSLVKKKTLKNYKCIDDLKQTSIVFAYAWSFMYFYFVICFSPDVLYQGHNITYELNIFLFCTKQRNDMKQYNFFPYSPPPPGLRRIIYQDKTFNKIGRTLLKNQETLLHHITNTDELQSHICQALLFVSHMIKK